MSVRKKNIYFIETIVTIVTIVTGSTQMLFLEPHTIKQTRVRYIIGINVKWHD